ncbi:MAG: AAA family ATPase [Candidatus Micrarchaeota archaeon]|nr:AAA family ATPase [Candidatus Micrarchaeota archaeon]
MANPYTIRISSQKGGVGKTTISVNLAVALRNMGHKVLIVDADYVNPVVGFHLGLENINKGFKSVMLGKANLANSISIHSPTGIHVLGGEQSSGMYEPNQAQIKRFDRLIKSTSYDFVIIDTPPGFSQNNFFGNSDEAAIVITPDIQATASAMRLSQIFGKLHLKHSIVINRVRNRRWELNVEQIEDTYGNKVSALFPEDDSVPMSIASKIPVFMYSTAPFTKVMEKFSRGYSLQISVPPAAPSGGGIIGWLRRVIGF